mgnify:CR=1 FL=1
MDTAIDQDERLSSSGGTVDYAVTATQASRQSLLFEIHDSNDVGDRFIALAIDTFIVSAIGGIFGVNGGGIFGGGILGFIIGVGYQWYFLTQQNGQTPGKMLMGLRVIRTDGEPIRDADAVLRYIGYLINSAVMMLGWLWGFFDPQNQGWHDKIAQTFVIKDTAVREKSKNKFVNV